MHLQESLSRFLLERYPRMHMVLYDAVAGDEGLRRTVLETVERIRSAGPAELDSISGTSEDALPGAKRVVNILVRLANLRLDVVLDYLYRAATERVVQEDFDGVVLSRYSSERWKRKYEAGSVYDIVLFVPRWSRAVALSTTEVDSAAAEELPLLAAVELRNFHLYCSFNRARGVRGRVVAVGSDRTNPLAQRMLSLTRSCGTAEEIARGMNLRYFTPLNTENGLRLGFFFTLEADVKEVVAVPSAGGVGYDLSQTELTLDDGTGVFKLRLNTHVFLACKESQSVPASAKDPMSLKGSSVVVIGVRFLGSPSAYCTYVGVEDRLDGGIPVLGYLNSVKKARVAAPDGISVSMPDFAVELGGWTYYKEPTWPGGAFKLMAIKGFANITLRDILQQGLDVRSTREWTARIRDYLAVNDHTREQYLSENPEGDFHAMAESAPHNPDLEELEKRETVEEKALPPLVSLTRWPEVLAAYQRLKGSGYEVEDIFEWDNGGYSSEVYWRRLGRVHNSPNEMLSALYFILQARGEVHVPV